MGPEAKTGNVTVLIGGNIFRERVVVGVRQPAFEFRVYFVKSGGLSGISTCTSKPFFLVYSDTER
jgi:hypothetical protein